MTKPKTKPKAATRSTARKTSKPIRRAQSAPMSSKPATGAHTKHARLLDEGHCAPPKLERATGSLRDLWRSRLAGMND